MYENPYDRKFGIEFEFSMPFLREFRTRKFELMENLLEENGLKNFSVGLDGSEFEVRTPILSGPNGFKTVKKFLNLVLKNGAFAHETYDGLHVHHDAPEFINNKTNVVKLVENWVENQNEIVKMVASRRNGSSACALWQEHHLSELERTFGTQGAYFGRRNLNITSLTSKGTIEIRLHEGTLDYEEVFSWVRFGQAFIGKTLEETGENLGGSENPMELLRKVNISRNASRFITKKMVNRYGSIITA